MICEDREADRKQATVDAHAASDTLCSAIGSRPEERNWQIHGG
jgi:hypothetical protein